MNMISPETIVLPLTRNGLRLAGDTTNKLKADHDHKRANESAIPHREGWQCDCTKMLDLL